jgi:2,4-dienoyl-CoA reductase-like NADH-dependent reductase (Old Yellow Enzyme family)
MAKAALSECLADNVGGPDVRLAALYERWSRGGAGLLVTGNVMVDRRHNTEAHNVVLDGDWALDAFARWAQAGRVDGTDTIVQLSHPGRQGQRLYSARPVAPSAVKVKLVPGLFAAPRVLTHNEILELIQRFARSAELAATAGFSGVQIHAAHGYLVSQFLSPRTNLRTDEWGGSLNNRARLLLEIIRAVRDRTPHEFIVSVKLNSADFQKGGFGEDESVQVAQMLERDGVDLLEISGGTYEAPVMFGVGSTRESTLRREAFFLDYARKVREATALPLMLTGGFRTAAGMEQAVGSGAIDVVGLGRPLIFDPSLPAGVLAGRQPEETPAAPRVGLRLDFALDNYWHLQHLQRLASGRPAGHRGLLRTVARQGVMTARWQLQRRRYRRPVA